MESTFFKYCPNCKSTQLIFIENIKFFCPICNFEYYHNTAGAVAVIIKQQNRLLLTIRNKNPKKGFLDLPGGFIDPKESAEIACVRELNEELSLNINAKLLQYKGSNPNQYTYNNITYNTIDLFYLYEDDDLKILNFDPIELDGYKWIEISKMNIEEIAFESQKKFLNEFKTDCIKGEKI